MYGLLSILISFLYLDFFSLAWILTHCGRFLNTCFISLIFMIDLFRVLKIHERHHWEILDTTRVPRHDEQSVRWKQAMLIFSFLSFKAVLLFSFISYVSLAFPGLCVKVTAQDLLVFWKVSQYMRHFILTLGIKSAFKT